MLTDHQEKSYWFRSIMGSVRNKLPFQSHKQKTNTFLATNQQKRQAISPQMLKLSIAAEQCKEHSKLNQLRHDCLREREPCQVSPHSGAIQSQPGTNTSRCLGMASHHGHLPAHKFSVCHCKCAVEQCYFYIPSDFRTVFLGQMF